eukprot:7378510-Prymnesium_polylepis.2
MKGNERAPFLDSRASDEDAIFVVVIQLLAHTDYGDRAFGCVHEHVTGAKAFQKWLHLLILTAAHILIRLVFKGAL